MNILNVAHLFHNGDGGDAAAIRTNFIMKGLAEQQCNIKTVSYAHDKNALIKYKKNDEKFSYLSQRYIEKKIFRNLFKLIMQPILLFSQILNCRKKTDIVFFDRVPAYLTVSLLLAKMLFRVKFVWGVNEFPVSFVNEKPYSFKAFVELLSFKVLGRVADLIIVISSEHETCYKKLSTGKTKTLIIPILMNTDECTEVEKIISPKKLITYCGALSTSNGIDFLVNVAKELMVLTNDFKISIFGPSISTKYLESLRQKITLLGLQDYIELTGAVSNKEAIEYIQRSDVLVIPKVKDKRAIGYIPSKMGDYLFSGKPVVFSNVGDVPKYIKHGVNGYLVEPDNIMEFAKCLHFIITNYDESFVVGQEGRRTSCLFDYKIQSQSIKNALNEL
ncbi:glycosyltransferase [Pseudoalteromonas shioyasakiensis]|nr:glycosyltransferase [Pseudoalteromonas shioyasakiensis]